MQFQIKDLYTRHLLQGVEKNTFLLASCPFCASHGYEKAGKIIVSLKRKSFFYGYFRCSQCEEHGFSYWFASLMGEADDAIVLQASMALFNERSLPKVSIQSEIETACIKLQNEEIKYFQEAGLSPRVLQNLRIGFNGRYIVYPYEQWNGNIYSARCVHPDREDDYFWTGDETFAGGETGLFNLGDLKRCLGGTLFLCEGEDNLLLVRQLGYPGIACQNLGQLESLADGLFASIDTLFLLPRKKEESLLAAHRLATRIGHKVRILQWPSSCAQGYSLRSLAVDCRHEGGGLAQKLAQMVAEAKPFSPFPDPRQEAHSFFNGLAAVQGEEYKNLRSGFPLLDQRIDGVHGITILGGGPKVGKSNFMLQIATTMAAAEVPVLYYDFENGRQRLYERSFIRMSRLERAVLENPSSMGEEELQIFKKTQQRFGKMLHFFKVINERKVNPDSMRHHIDFLRHETRSDYVVVVIDSLHKLPFKDLSERRNGIDGWLREMEAMRDSLQVSFLVISELDRGNSGSYGDAPHMGIFKGSGDIEYSADNAMVLLPSWNHMERMDARKNALWLVGSREHSPGLVAEYALDYPYWGFCEYPAEITATDD